MIAYPTIPDPTPAVDPVPIDPLMGDRGVIDQPTVPDAGWYVDPDRADRVRWWNGQMWTGRIGGDGDPIAWHDHLGELPPPQPGTRIFSIVRSEPETEPQSEPVIDLTSSGPSVELPVALPVALLGAAPGVQAPSRHVAPFLRVADVSTAEASPTEVASEFWDGAPILVPLPESRFRRVAQKTLAAAAAVVVALGGAATAAIIFR